MNLPGGKQTDRKCLECTVTYQLNHEERVFQIPTTAGGHDYIQQTGTQHSRLSQPFRRTRPSCSAPLYSPGYPSRIWKGRNKTHLASFFLVVLKSDRFSLMQNFLENVFFSSCALDRPSVLGEFYRWCSPEICCTVLLHMNGKKKREEGCKVRASQDCI